MTKRQNPPAAEPNSFRVCAYYEQGINGYMLSVHTYERIVGTEQEGLSYSFVADLDCLPALHAELGRILKKATREGAFIRGGDNA